MEILKCGIFYTSVSLCGRWYNTSRVTENLKWTPVLAKIDSSIETRVLVHSPNKNYISLRKYLTFSLYIHCKWNFWTSSYMFLANTYFLLKLWLMYAHGKFTPYQCRIQNPWFHSISKAHKLFLILRTDPTTII